MHRFLPALAYQAGARITEVPVAHHPRVSGRSKYGLGRTIKVLLDLVTVKFLSVWSTKPSYVFGGSGAILCLLGTGFVRWTAYQKLVNDVYVYRQPSLVVGVFLLTIGLNLFLMGLLAELVTRTYHESQSKPIYYVRERRTSTSGHRSRSGDFTCAGYAERSAPTGSTSRCSAHDGCPAAPGARRRRLLRRASTTTASPSAWAFAASRSSTSSPATSRSPTRTAPCRSSSTARSTTSPSSAAELEEPWPSLLDERRHRGHPASLRRARPPLRRAPERHVRVRALGRDPARAPARARPVRQEAPLLRARSAGRSLFGSELKSLLEHPSCPPELDRESLSRYLALEYVPTPYAIFAGVRKLPGGHVLRWREGQATVERYWDLSFETRRSRRIDDDEYAEELHRVFERRCAAASMSDVPLGAFLSGGIDSSSVVAMMVEQCRRRT